MRAGNRESRCCIARAGRHLKSTDREQSNAEWRDNKHDTVRPSFPDPRNFRRGERDVALQSARKRLLERLCRDSVIGGRRPQRRELTRGHRRRSARRARVRRARRRRWPRPRHSEFRLVPELELPRALVAAVSRARRVERLSDDGPVDVLEGEGGVDEVGEEDGVVRLAERETATQG